ncbi:MAG: hypothetical protein WCC11_06145 [Gammaproteobacteria bacterium]
MQCNAVLPAATIICRQLPVFGLNQVLTAWLPTVLLAVISGIAVSRIR